MKRTTTPFLAVSLILCNCTYLIHSSDPPDQTTEKHIPISRPNQEFDLSIDESGVGAQMVIVSVVNGESAVCLSEKPRFARGTALILYKRGYNFSLERSHITFQPLVRIKLSAFFPVKLKESKSALFLLSDDGNLIPRPVRTLYLRPRNASIPDNSFDGLRIGDSRSFSIAGEVYTIRVSNGPTSQAGTVAVLVLENQRQKQIIWYGTIHEKENEVVELDWVGDLDGDERLDLLFRYFELNGGGSVDVLLLSSHAKPDSLIGPAAFSFARDCH